MWKITKCRGPWLTEGLSERRYHGGSRRELVVKIEPRCVVYWPFGTRKEFRITHEKIYELAVKAFADAQPRRRRRTVRRGVMAI